MEQGGRYNGKELLMMFYGLISNSGEVNGNNIQQTMSNITTQRNFVGTNATSVSQGQTPQGQTMSQVIRNSVMFLVYKY